MGYSDNYIVLPVMKALQVLEFVAERGHPVGLTEAAQELQLPKTTVFRYLQTLSASGFLTHDVRRDRYAVGTRFRELARRDSDVEGLRGSAQPEMLRLMETFRETVNLAVMVDRQVVYLEVLEPRRTQRPLARVGQRDPVHSTSLGKAMAAFQRDCDPSTFWSDALEQRTINTLTDQRAFRRHMDDTQKRGYAIEIGENEHGVMCIGVPIFDTSGHAVAAMSLSAPETRMKPELAEQAATALQEAASRVSQGLMAGLARPDATGIQ